MIVVVVAVMLLWYCHLLTLSNFSYVQPTADIKDEASYVNGLAIINGRLLQNGEEVLTVGLQECLQSLLLWLSEIKELAGGRKPILLAHHGFAFHFKIFCHTLEICR